MIDPPFDKLYGFVGWRELLRVRRDLLEQYDKSKEYNVSRPVRTAHGNAGEAYVRQWLTTFLPSKYGVTSGYVIPGIAVDAYTLLEYDVIIYDRLNAPILWVDENPDRSDLGQKQAIPADYVQAVCEVKARFTRQNVVDALGKLAPLNQFARKLPPHFITFLVFFELDCALADKSYVLRHAIPDEPLIGYRGGLILRCNINPI